MLAEQEAECISLWPAGTLWCAFHHKIKRHCKGMFFTYWCEVPTFEWRAAFEQCQPMSSSCPRDLMLLWEHLQDTAYIYLWHIYQPQSFNDTVMSNKACGKGNRFKKLDWICSRWWLRAGKRKQLVASPLWSAPLLSSTSSSTCWEEVVMHREAWFELSCVLPDSTKLLWYCRGFETPFVTSVLLDIPP